MRAFVGLAAAVAASGCAHLQPMTDADVVAIAGRALHREKLGEEMNCRVHTETRTWYVDCQAREKNVLDGGVYVTIDQRTRRVIRIRYDA